MIYTYTLREILYNNRIYIKSIVYDKYKYNPAILKYISPHRIDQLHFTHRPDYTMLYNLTSSATEAPTF